MSKKQARRSIAKLKRAETAARAGQLRLQGKTLLEIGKALDCSITTVFHLLEDGRRAWWDRAAEDRGKWIAQELARMEGLYADLYVQWERSKEDKEVRTVEKNKDGEKAIIRREGQAGDPDLAGRLIEIHKRICEMKGLDAPKRSELSGPEGGPIRLKPEQLTDDELAVIAARGRLLTEECGERTFETKASPPAAVGLRIVPPSVLSGPTGTDELAPPSPGGEVGPGS